MNSFLKTGKKPISVPQISLPHFTTVEQIMDFEKYPPSLVSRLSSSTYSKICYMKLFFTLQKSWMIQEGGMDIKDHTKRVMGRLIGPSLQCQLNRTGTYGKHKLPEQFESLLKGECLNGSVIFSWNYCIVRVYVSESGVTLFGVSRVEVEKAIRNFLKNARDRDGGRDARRHGEPSAKRPRAISSDSDSD